MDDRGSKASPTMQQARTRLDAAVRAHEAERSKPYNKWARYDAKQEEFAARAAYAEAKVAFEAERGVHAVTNGVVRTRKSVTINGVKVPVVRRIPPHVDSN